MNKTDFKALFVIAACIVTSCLAFFMNNVLEMHALYSSLFYIPVIMIGIWFYRAVIPVALAFAFYSNALDFAVSPVLLLDEVFRGGILILGAVILFYLGKKLKQKNKELAGSQNVLAAEKERLRVTLMSIGDGVICTDADGKVTFLNDVAKNLTGWDEKNAAGKLFNTVFHIIHEDTRKQCEDPVQKVLLTGEIIGLANHTVLIAKDGTERPVADSAAPIRDKDGRITGVVMVFRDVSHEKTKQSEIEFLSYHDPLTGLGNRRYMEKQLNRIDKEEYLPVSVIMGDVNGLKLTNDAFGHNVGDELIQKAALTLQKLCREDDIICRYGGDEFVVILPKTTGEEAHLITQNIRKAFLEISIGPVKFSMSLGWAVKNNFQENIRETMKAAENFMYEKKLYESPSIRGKIVKSLMNTLISSSEGERNHAERISEMCAKMANAFRLGEDDVEKYKLACKLHDIGKIAIDKRILNKNGELSLEEKDTVKHHPETGYRILSAVPDFAEISEYVLAHHERWDGKGYPRGLKGEEIPYISRIIAVMDAYDAMTSENPFRNVLDEETAAHEILKQAGTQFDPEIARIFVQKLQERDAC